MLSEHHSALRPSTRLVGPRNQPFPRCRPRVTCVSELVLTALDLAVQIPRPRPGQTHQRVLGGHVGRSPDVGRTPSVELVVTTLPPPVAIRWGAVASKVIQTTVSLTSIRSCHLVRHFPRCDAAAVDACIGTDDFQMPRSPHTSSTEACMPFRSRTSAWMASTDRPGRLVPASGKAPRRPAGTGRSR